ncbi:Rib/alpha-like domain-containing protein [Ligilactobacillus murinus]|nr:Rib/alpha-like domain-containing protein [Ligilactobacillus murinus]
MKRYKYDQLRKAQQEKLYYKMYKAGKNWIVMGLTVVGVGILFPSLAKADDQEETLNTEVVQEDLKSDQNQGMDNTENELRQLGPEEVIETDKQVQNSTSVVAEQANENISEVLADNEQVVSTDLSADAQVETVSQETPQIEQSTPRSAFRSVDMRAAQEKSEVPNARTEQELKKYLESSNGLMAKNSLTTPILPNPTTSSATTEDTFDEDMLSRAPRPIKSEWRSLSHYAVYYPFVKKLQAAYQAKDFKEVMNNIALINAFKKRSRAEYKIGFKEADNYTADIALRDSERSAAVIISMDQDGHIITESRTRDNKPFYGYVTGSGTVYKLTDDKEYYQGSFSEQNGTASAKVEYQVGKNGAQDYNDYNGNIADKINNRPEAKLGQYDYVGTDYYYANAAHDLIKYNDNDPKKDKFAVTKMDDLANATPNDYTITLVVNHYRKASTTVEEAQTTITYKDDSGANVTPKTQVRVAGSVGSNVAIPTAPEVSGYTLKEIKFNGAVKHTGDKVTLNKSNTLEYVYKKVAEIATIDISYKAGTQELQPARPVILSGEVGSSVAIPVAPEISEYKLKEIKFNGVTKDADTQVTLDKTNKLEYIYDKNAVSAQVTISYRAGDKVLVPTKPVTLSGKVGDIVVIPAAPMIANYHFVGATIDGERIDPGMNTVLAATNELIYKYAEDAKLAHTTVMYKDTKGNVLNVSEPVSLTGNVGANVNLPAAPTISGYTLDSIVFNQVPRRVGNTVSLAAENTLEYIYLKDPVVANITVSYRAGEIVLTPTNEVKFSGNIDEEVRVPLAPDVRGYQFKKATFNGKEILPNASVTLAESNTLIYNYERLRIPAKVTFEYVNESGQTVKPLGVATLIGKIGDTVKLSNAPMLLKHQLKEIRFNGTVKTVGDNVTLEPENTVIYVYMAKEEKPATVTVSYKDDQGNNVAPNTQVAVRGNVGAKVNVPQAPSVTGYTLKEVKFNGVTKAVGAEVSLAETNTVEYIYSKVVEAAQTTVSYKAGTQTVTPTSPVTVTGNVGDKVNVPQAPEVSGYHVVGITFNGQKVEANSQVTLTKQNELVYNYAADVRPATVTVSYKDDQGNAVTPNGQVTIKGDTGAKLNLPEGPSVTGYTLKEVKFNGVTKAVGAEVSLAETNTVEYIYSKVVEAAQTTVSYKAGTQTLIPASPVTVTGNVGDKVNVPQAPEVSGYHVVGITFNGQNVTANSQVTLTKQNELVYNYAADVKPAKITLSYKDDQGNAVTPNGQVTINGDTGAKLNLPEGPSVTGHTLKEVKFNGVTKAVGDEVSLAETNTVEYIYSKVVEAAQTTVSYKAGTQTLTPANPVNVTGNVGDKVNVPQALEVSGYHVVGITFNGQNVTSGSEVTLTKQNELVYNYAADVKPAKITLSYKDDQGNAVTPNGQVTIKGDTGAKLNLPEGPSVTGHTLKEVKFNGVTKAVGDEVSLAETNTVEYIYSKVVEAAQTTVSYKAGTQTLTPASPVTVTGNVGDKVNVPQAPEVSGYHVVGITFNGQNVTANSQVTLTKQNELVYNYAADVKPAKITLSYKDDQGNAVTPNGQVTINGDTGAKLNLPEGPSVTGYTLKEVKFNGVTKAVGDEVSLAETNTVEYIYSKVVEAAQTTVSYKAGTQTLTPANLVNVTGNVGDKVNVPQAPEVSGYHVVGITFNGQKVEATNQVTLTKENELVYNYAADVKPAKITLSYKDDQGNAVTPNGQVTINGDTGAKLNLPEGPSVTGYTLKEVKFNGVTKAVGDEVSLAETNTVEYIYSNVVKAAQTTVSYKAGTQTLTPANPVNVTGNVGDKVNVPQAPEVSGYHVVGITFNGQNVTSGSEVTLTKQNELVYNYEAKLVDEHVLQLNIIDDTTQKVLENGIVLGKGLLNEPVAKDVVDKYNAKFEELRTKGYDVRSYDELPADYTADKTLTIHVTHGTKEVAGPDRTVNVLLEYVYGNGPKQGSFAAEPYKEEHTFTSINVVDKVTGEIVETKWSLPTASPVIKTPKAEGYVADKATVKIPDITPDSKDVKLNVTYLTILPKENIKIEWGHALAAKDVIIVPEKLENLVINQTWKLVPDFKPTSLTDRLTSGIVTVTLSDGTKLDVEVEIEVAKLSESNEPKVDQVTISKDKQLDPKQVVNNLAELPDRTQLEWVKEPTALADGVLNVKYPDGSNNLVEVKVKKTAIADDATQTPKDINEAGIKATLEIKTTDQTETEMPKTTELPQTSGKIDNTAGILGIVVATLGGLLGFGTTKHKKKS